jgi:4-diphosphocytidyl-2-C-methyl-D-erythritol kinase
VISFPNAKINIGLNIIRKRDDGFHDIESVMYPISLCDALEIIEDPEADNGIEFHSSGISIPGKPEQNLCVKAYHLIAKDYALPKIKVHLHKHIPIGAGLGGGSSDAAFFIKLLNEKFSVGISWGEMHHYARQLGSDCSFFVSNKPAFAEGRGDQFESLTLKLEGYHLVLIYPSVHISTAEAYAGVTPKQPDESLEHLISTLPPEEWKGRIHNDFEDSIFPRYTQLKAILDRLYEKGAVYASMSGSGSSVYGLFKNSTDLRAEFPTSFVFQAPMR